MMVMGYSISSSTEQDGQEKWTLRTIHWFLYFAGVATLSLGCAEVHYPADTSSAIQVPSTLSTVDILQPVAPPYSLAILPFEDYSNRSDLGWLRQGLPDMLVTDLALLPGVRVVSRHRLGEVLREQWLQHRGSFEEASSVRLGRLVGARYLLSGLYYVGGDDLILEVHLLDVEQGAVVRTFRVTGPAQSIPELELDLASRLGHVFDTAAEEQIENPVSTVEKESSIVQLDPQDIRDIQQESGVALESSDSHVPLTSTLRTDTVLGLERLRHVREAATTIANDLWAQVLKIRFGALRYESQSATNGGLSSLTVNIPVSATIREEVLPKLDSALQVVELGGPNGAEIVLAYEESDAGAQQLFREALQSPRRLFVRAIRESGEVLAVSSEWSWRMDFHVRSSPDGTVSLLRSSTPFLKGSAHFPGALLARHESTVTFDALVLPVSDESRTVSVEIVENQGVGELSFPTNEDWIASVHTWFLHHWFPPVAESIPTSGYLPGNRRHGVALVSGMGGTITQIQIIHLDEEEKFADSVNDVLNKLPGECFQICENSDPTNVVHQPFTLRVQFELTKDIRHAGLGRLR
jgi:TolB-like protein